MRFRLRTLLIVLAVGPPVLAAIALLVYWEPVPTIAGGSIVLFGGLFLHAVWWLCGRSTDNDP